MRAKMIHKPCGPYEKFFKRPFDLICALAGLLFFWWIFVIIALLICIKLGRPVLFVQERPGKEEKIFKLYKFRTMTDKRDIAGQLLPDKMRLTNFGKWLRSTSLDELPELWNIVKGDMSMVGPRPQLVKDMVFMTAKERGRHSVLPGLTGLAQVNGRNGISWEDKLYWDLRYINHISFWTDVAILMKTFAKVIKKDNITADGMETAEDLGDYLLRTKKVTSDEYAKKQAEADFILQSMKRT